MQNEVDSKFILSVFDIIRRKGVQQENGNRLLGVTVYSDFDGYNLYLEDNQVKLHVGFHNQYHFTYSKQEHFEQFMKTLKRIERESTD
jgi:hypothetical protein